MKTLDKKASEILQKLLALQQSKIDNTDGVYMPVHIEIIEKTSTPTFRWLITDGKTEMPCVTLK